MITHATDVDYLRVIAGFQDANGYCPTNRDVMEALGYRSVSTVNKRLCSLRDLAWVDWVDGYARTLHLTSDGYAHAAAG